MRMLDTGIATTSERISAAQLLGCLYHDNQQHEKALRILQAASNLLSRETLRTKQGAEVMHMLGKCKLKLGRAEEAKRDVNQALDTVLDILPAEDIFIDEVRETLAEAYLQEHNFPEATQQLDSLCKNPASIQRKQLSASRLRQLSMFGNLHCGAAHWSKALEVVTQAAAEAAALFDLFLATGMHGCWESNGSCALTTEVIGRTSLIGVMFGAYDLGVKRCVLACRPPAKDFAAWP
jgi:tetratricopeptide (TPR) repeat protein